ncbi:hypothetical protein NEOLEDRAFT_1131435 [Neolentinus lepideus HHB14362 ss-1]|uniref:Peroxisomal biogenesis factor 11 n=1 Tax=Neolentinus lepideus HHB14362 ss-1 TaxID=1314782 RepID=A0A165TNS3_9AGAM|nr:hypothetical protein NEOLEDRAFT_1131435 [Neolentinus lepideus HHB14362 ss-1]
MSMSFESVPFPHERARHESVASTSSFCDDTFYPSSFDVPTTSFQMNPLSSHPPRTPRTSIISNTSKVHAPEMYSLPEKTELQSVAASLEEDVVEVEENTAKKEAVSRIRNEEIWREILKTTVGRDKAFKLMQYSLKVYLLFHSSVMATGFMRNRGRPVWELELVKRLEETVSGFSLTRRCLIMFDWLTPLTSIQAQQSVPFSLDTSPSKSLSKPKPKPILHSLLHAPPLVLLGLLNGFADDVYTFSRLGLLGGKAGQRAGKFADWCWLLSTLAALVENNVEMAMVSQHQREVESRLYTESMAGATAKSQPTNTKIDDTELQRLNLKMYWLQVTRTKLLMDLVFVSYDVFQFKRAKAPVQALTGLTAAALSTAKLYDRHKNALVKTISAGFSI